MRARAELTAAPPPVAGGPCRLLRLRHAAPLSWRPTPDAVYLVGSAATPVSDDRVEIDVRVEGGAVLRLRSAAATVAWWAPGTAHLFTASVADGAMLDWQPEPLIATAGCHHVQHTQIALEGTGRVRWVEELVLGRHREQPGQLDLRLDVDLDGWPLLRHQLALGPGATGWDSPAVVAGRRCLGLVLEAGLPAPSPAPAPASRAPKPSSGASGPASWARLQLEGPGSLTLAAADDLLALRHALAAAADFDEGIG